jgi:phospholipid/cholesterol/gamma-HCH transport system substrate-binding protein
MERKDTLKKFLAGLFFLVGVALLLVIVFLIGIERGMTQPKFQVTVLFRDVGGLGVGAPVRLSGVDVGTVARIDFLSEKVDDRGVRVVLNIFRKYKKQLDTPALYAIKTEGILGQKIVEISPTFAAGGFDLSKPIIGQDPLDVQNLAEAFQDTADSFIGLTGQTTSIIKELQYLTRTSKRVLDRIEERVIEGKLLKLF